MRSILRRTLTLTAAAFVAAAIAAGAASAGLISGIVSAVVTLAPLQALGNCGYPSSSQVFAPWGDSDYYSLMPEGDLAATGGWSFGGVTLSSDHDPYSGAAGSVVFGRNGAVATTPASCSNLQNPTMRFFVADRGGFGRGYVDVTLLYQALDGSTQTASLGRVSAGGSGWQPSQTLSMPTNLLSLLETNGQVPIAFRFTAGGLSFGETFSVDGIFVDPFRST